MDIHRTTLFAVFLLVVLQSSSHSAKCLFHKYVNVTLGQGVAADEEYAVQGSYSCEILCIKKRLECVAVHVTIRDDDRAICLMYRELPVPFQQYPDTGRDSRLLVRKDVVHGACESNPCQFNSTCADQHDSYKCICDVGYRGENCELEDICVLTLPCLNGGTCTLTDAGGTYTCQCAAEYSGSHCETHCIIYGFHGNVTNVTDWDKEVFVETSPSYHGEWLVLMRRQDGSVDFPARSWAEYRDGFGDFGEEFWLGTDAMYKLTNNGSTWRLRVDMKNRYGPCRHAEYSNFKIDSEADRYKLHVSGYLPSSDAEDSLTDASDDLNHDGYTFDTQDNPDPSKYDDMTLQPPGGWWYSPFYGYTTDRKLTGPYGKVWGISWASDKSLLYADMKITTN